MNTSTHTEQQPFLRFWAEFQPLLEAFYLVRRASRRIFRTTISVSTRTFAPTDCVVRMEMGVDKETMFELAEVFKEDISASFEQNGRRFLKLKAYASLRKIGGSPCLIATLPLPEDITADLLIADLRKKIAETYPQFAPEYPSSYDIRT